MESNYTVDVIQDWYLNRTIEIENSSGLVDVALNFAKLALANGCKNMNEIIENLQTLYTLVYECKNNNDQTYYTLKYITSLDELEKLTLIMSHSYDSGSELYTKNLQEWLIPFIQRRSTVAKRESLLRNYLTKVSVNDLNPCVKFLNLKFKTNNLFNELNFISILIECLYVNENANQIDLCNLIVNELTTKTTSELINLNSNRSLQHQQANKMIINNDLSEKLKTAHLHLKACDIFKKYGVNKSLTYIRDSCLNIENCRDALTKLTWFAAKRTSHLKLNEWIDLMKDLHYLQSNVYSTLISYQDCSEIFLTSLLGSRNLENIKLASDWLKDILAVDKESAVNLAVKAAQEYFNASSNFSDPDMQFAKECLNLVKTLLVESKLMHNKHQKLIEQSEYKSFLNEMAKQDPNINECVRLIETETDLITSMKITADFGLNILPVQVRVSLNRLEIIKDILKINDQAYKDYDKLLKLASLLRIDSNEVMLLIAEHSLIKDKLHVVNEMCNKLVELNYSPAWNCVYKLAFDLSKNIIEQFKINYKIKSYERALIDANTEFDLSNFYLNHKDSLFKSIRNHDFNSQFNTLFSNKAKTITNLIDIERLLAFSLTHCASHLIELILLQKNDIEIARLKLQQTESTTTTKTTEILKIDRLTSDYFYNQTSTDFDIDSFKKTNDKVHLLLSSILENKKNETLNEKLLLNCLNDLIRIDGNLALALLLELNEQELLDLSIENLFKYETSIAYEFVLYYFALNLIKNQLTFEEQILTIEDCYLNKKLFIYYLKSSDLISLFDNMDDLNNNNNNNLIFKTNAYKSFRKLNRNFTEYKQNQALNKLNAGIDLKRFETDEQYKHDTILGLSMDLNTFDLSCSLAKFYDFNLWKVYITFTEYLFEISPTSEISLSSVKEKLEPLLTLLRSKQDDFNQIMNTQILDLIDGTDLDKMTVFYEILNDEHSDFHIKTIKKLKSMSFNKLNYKNLLNNPLETIQIYLDDSNQAFFAKLLPKLPIKSETHLLNSSKIYVLWCSKKIWSQIDEMFDDHLIEWTNENMNLFYDKFENLNESLKKLDFETDFAYFVQELILSAQSCSKLNIQIRKNLLKRLVKIFKQFTQQQNKQFEKTTNILSSIQNYLKILENIQKLFDQTNVIKKEVYFQKLDFALSNYLIESENETDLDNKKNLKLKKLEDIFIDMFFNDFDIDLVSNVITTADLNEINIKHLIKLALTTTCSLLKEYKDEAKKNDQLSKLKILLDNISSNLEKNEAEILNQVIKIEFFKIFINF
jgi:neuroblastoma-amplified sequence